MKRFRQIERGEWRGYIVFTALWFILAVITLAVGRRYGFGLNFFVCFTFFISVTIWYLHGWIMNPRTYNYRVGKGFIYYRISDNTSTLIMCCGLAIYLIAIVLYCLSDVFNWWMLSFGMIGAVCIPIIHMKRKTDRIGMEKPIRLAERLQEIGVLRQGEVIHAAHGNVYENVWSTFTQRYPSTTMDFPEKQKDNDEKPLHLLVVTEYELVMCTKKPHRPFTFSTIALTDIRQLYVSAASYEEIMTSSLPKKYNQMLVIGNGNYRQYHFEFTDGVYSQNIHPFIRQLLLCIDDAYRRVKPVSIPKRAHPAYIPFENIPMLSSTDEVYLPFMKPSR